MLELTVTLSKMKNSFSCLNSAESVTRGLEIRLRTFGQ